METPHLYINEYVKTQGGALHDLLPKLKVI